VLANDSDPDGDALTISITSQPGHGAATVNNLQIVYTPNADFVGSDSFTYTIVDGKGGNATATVTVTVSAQSGSQMIYLPLIEQ
ncbi:MAG: cadherin-like domain-containing protein, partial [Caldilineaceae bacterium]|nr:cadherin-like domain-containing protein [Caldilineaceae bacterium]